MRKKEGIIVDEPRKDKYYEENPSAIDKGIIAEKSEVKNLSVRNNPCPQRSSEASNRKEYQPSF